MSGYFDEPFYNTDPDAGLHRVSVAELEQMIFAHKFSARLPLSSFRLTERLSGPKLVALRKKLHGSDERSALDSIADLSEFLPPPSSEIPADPAPDMASQQKVLAAVEAYLNHTISKLPDFFATRSTIHYGETAAYKESSVSIEPVPLHVKERSKATVLYRQGKEVIENAKRPSSTGGQQLSTNGTFGTLLTLLQEAMQNKIRWSRWEHDGKRLLAVFLIEVSSRSPTVRLNGWQMPYTATIATSYHGEIAIDPSSGAIFRLQFKADLQGFVPSNQSKTLVIYGPAEIEGKVYILPLRSIGVMNLRTVPRLQAWNLGFHTWGPLETQINDFTFDHYHKFGSTMRILPSYGEVPDSTSIH